MPNLRCLALLLLFPAALPGQEFGRRDPHRVHDPSAIVREGDSSYFFCTGHGVTLVKENEEGEWLHAGRVFQRRETPAWHQEKVPENRGHLWAPDVIKLNGLWHLYYLFLNHGLCCRGLQSTYEIRVGRSKTITGPYLDQSGTDLKVGGGTLVLKSEGERIGPGHASILKRDGREFLAHHYYSKAHRGAPRFGLVPLTWKDGWPSAGSPGPGSSQ